MKNGPGKKPFSHYTPNEELDNILYRARDGMFADEPSRFFAAVAASLAKRGMENNEMFRLYEKIGPFLRKRANAAQKPPVPKTTKNHARARAQPAA